jgi:NAD(P)-dependent dehydrogenase (short-subunit alcohol dehydrogenase family)
VLQALVEREAGRPVRLWVITRGAQPTADPPTEVTAAMLWGLGRVVALEHPELWGGLVDLDPDGDDHEVPALVQEITKPDGEDQVAYRNQKRLVARLVSCSGWQPREDPVAFHPDASYLITGGRGALGLRVAIWMAERGARHLILTGRRPFPYDAAPPDDHHDATVLAVLRHLESRGVTVETPAADVADRQAMAALLRSNGRPPVRGVVHAAGVFRPQALRQVSLDDLEAVLKPKVEGTLVLHELTRNLDLDCFVLFSSAASVWGSALAGHYVAANHFLDVVAHARQALGLPALAVNWGWWTGSDMVPPEASRYFEAMGLQEIPADLGLAALEQLLSLGKAQRTVAPVDWRRFKPVFEAKRWRPFLDLIELPPMQGETASAEGLELIRQLGEAPAAARLELVVDYLQRKVGEVLGLSAADRMDPILGFFESGMDSITSVELKTRLEIGLGIVLPATAAFEYPNITALAGYLLDRVIRPGEDPGKPEEGSIEAAVQERQASRSDDEQGLEHLSEDELLHLLAEELKGGELR